MVDKEADLNKYVPENPVSPIPVVIFGGMGVPIEAYRLLRKRLADHGFTTLFPIPLLNAEDRARKLLLFTDVNKIKQEQASEVITTAGEPNSLGIKQVDIIAHSNAAPFIVPVIKEHPQNVHKLILLSPAGVHPEMNPFLAVLKLWQKERRNKKDKRQLERLGLLKPDEKPYSKNWRCYYPEAAVTATRVITEDLENLIRGGLDAVVVILTQDSLFRRKDYLANLDPRIVKMVELPGYHSQARFDPTIGNRLACLLKD